MMHAIKHFKGIFSTWTCVGGKISAWCCDEKTCSSLVVQKKNKNNEHYKLSHTNQNIFYIHL